MTNLKKQLWYSDQIAGFTARCAHLGLDELLNNTGLGLYRSASDAFPPLFRFTDPADVVGFIREVYGCWVQLGEDGPFRLFDDRSVVQQQTDRARMMVAQVIDAGELVVRADPQGLPAVRPLTMRARFANDALYDLINTLDFKTCRHCGGWFPPSRSDARYCSSRCQTAFHRSNQKG